VGFEDTEMRLTMKLGNLEILRIFSVEKPSRHRLRPEMLLKIRINADTKADILNNNTHVFWNVASSVLVAFA
jgi:hypothetical protein